jgi:hypothetical protein
MRVVGQFPVKPVAFIRRYRSIGYLRNDLRRASKISGNGAWIFFEIRSYDVKVFVGSAVVDGDDTVATRPHVVKKIPGLTWGARELATSYLVVELCYEGVARRLAFLAACRCAFADFFIAFCCFLAAFLFIFCCFLSAFRDRRAPSATLMR